MKHLLITLTIACGCGGSDVWAPAPPESKLADLTDVQRACVRQCYELERCAGDRPDPCADFCLDDDGPAVMSEWLAACEGEQ